MYEKERKKYYNSLELNKITDNKTFWKTIKPFLSDKGTNINKFTLADKSLDKVISEGVQLCQTFSNFLEEVVKTLGDIDNFYMFSYSHSGPVNNGIRKHENLRV